MIIGAGDLSPSSPGFVKFILDDNLNIVETKKLGFVGYTVPKKKKFEIPNYKDIIAYDEDKYDFFNRTMMMQPYIFDFIKDCEYFILEDYALFGQGLIFQLAEYCSVVKFFLLNNGCKLRLITPLQLKQYATNNGHAQKPEMYDGFISKGYDKILDISDLPKIPVHKKGKFVGLRDKDGCSPLSDVVDSTHLCDLLYKELLIKKGVKQLSDLAPIEQHVLTHTTKNNKIPLIKRDFIENLYP